MSTSNLEPVFRGSLISTTESRYGSRLALAARAILHTAETAVRDGTAWYGDYLWGRLDRKMQFPALHKLCVLAALVLLGCSDEADDQTLLARAQELIAAGQGQAAIEILDAAAGRSPDAPAIRLLMAEAYLAAERGDLAGIALDQALARGADPNEVLMLRTDALLREGEYFELLELTPPVQLSPVARFIFLYRQAEARRALLAQKLIDSDAVAGVYVELFQLAERLADTPDLSAILGSLDAARQQEPAVDRAWQHFACGRNEVEATYWTPSAEVSENVIRVGAGREVKTPADAARIADDGAFIEIDPGTYVGGVARWPQHRLTVRGVGERPVVTANGQAVADRDVWLFEGDNVTIENVEISGARSRYENGAGIRHTGDGLTLRHVYLHDNENGLLTGNRHLDSHILIEYSEFAHNGDGKGQAHNIYVGRSGRLEMRYSYSHESDVGHLLKSRARENVITYNRLSDNDDGTSSYIIDIPEAGVARIIGNVLQQGYATANHALMSFGSEELRHDENRLVVANNTIYNRDFRGIGVRNAKNLPILMINNLVGGAPLGLVEGPAERIANQTLPEHGLADPREYHFELVSGAYAIDAGSDAGPTPTAEYVHPLGWRPRDRVWTIDIGAYERCGL